MHKKLMALVAIAAALLVGTAGGAWFSRSWPRGAAVADTWNAVREPSGNYLFTQPLLAVGDDPRLRVHGALEERVRGYARERTDAGKGTQVSMYMKDFGTSTWAGVDEEEQYVLASMYKVILMVALLRQGQRDPAVFQTSLVYDNPEPLRYGDNSNTSPDPIQPGKRYGIGDLITRMIVYSDNNAKHLLSAYVDRSVLAQTYRDLGVRLPERDDTDITMSAKSFSLFFRVLYNASYVDRALSEEALSILSQVVFRDGLVAGVPEGVPVAHKFGYRIVPETDVHELHDCGIVYLPEHPYLLCVMTRGAAYEDLRETIAGVSRLVYDARIAEFNR